MIGILSLEYAHFNGSGSGSRVYDLKAMARVLIP